MSNTSWKRKAQPTGSCQLSAKRCSARAALGVPAAAAGDDERALGGQQHRAQLAPARAGAGAASAGSTRGSTGGAVGVASMSSGSASTTGPGRPCIAVWKARATYSGSRSASCTSADPLGEAERAGAEHLPVVDLLERLAVALLARHLADEHDQRRRVLERGVDADRGVARARAAGDEADARPPAQLALRLGHEAGAALVAAGDEADALAVLVEAVEDGEEALAGHAERGVDALRDQRLDQGVAGRAEVSSRAEDATAAPARGAAAAPPASVPTSCRRQHAGKQRGRGADQHAAGHAAVEQRAEQRRARCAKPRSSPEYTMP